MSLGEFLRLSSRRHRRIFIACLATIGTAALVLGTLAFVRWRGEHAVRGDTRVMLDQASQQLIRSLESRRGTLTLLRDTLDKAPNLTLAERQTLAKSAVAHTRHLLGIGWLHGRDAMSWWASPSGLMSREQKALEQAVATRSRLRNVWRVPSTFTVASPTGRVLLVMLEPLRAAVNQSSGLAGIFDLEPLLVDFFELTLQQPYPVAVWQEDRALYRSSHWPEESDRLPQAIEQMVRIDAVNWRLHMQPGATGVVQAMSKLQKLLMAFSALAGAAITGLIWLLAMRTRILERAVRRRTAALRRAMQRLHQLAITDELTGAHNRRFFLERWQWEYARAKRYARPLACLMIDVNRFKRINDLLGHPTGDLLMKRVAEELRRQLRDADVLARFGGDEFIVALPETTIDQASAVAHKLRQLALEGPWTQYRQLGPVRLSVGVGHLEADEPPHDIIQKADADLYASRQRSPSDSRDPAPTSS